MLYLLWRHIMHTICMYAACTLYNIYDGFGRKDKFVFIKYTKITLTYIVMFTIHILLLLAYRSPLLDSCFFSVNAARVGLCIICIHKQGEAKRVPEQRRGTNFRSIVFYVSFRASVNSWLSIYTREINFILYTRDFVIYEKNKALRQRPHKKYKMICMLLGYLYTCSRSNFILCISLSYFLFYNS